MEVQAHVINVQKGQQQMEQELPTICANNLDKIKYFIDAWLLFNKVLRSIINSRLI